VEDIVARNRAEEKEISEALEKLFAQEDM